MLGVIVVLLLVWFALSILGVIIEGLFWLTVVGAVLLVATAAYAAIARDWRINDKSHAGGRGAPVPDQLSPRQDATPQQTRWAGLDIRGRGAAAENVDESR